MSEPSQPTPPVPQPQYGEYAPAGYVPPQQTGPQLAPAGYPMHPAPQAFGRRRKTWDLVLTIVLWVLGLLGMLAGVGYAFLFSDPVLLDEGFKSQGLPGFNGTVGAAPTVLVVSHVVLYLLAIGGAIPLLLSKRVAFWVPLAAGVIAAIIFWTTIVSVVMTDPAFIAQYS